MAVSPIPLFQVDAFTDRAFAGNPAAVCLLPAPRDDRWMQAVASEMNLSETAFLLAEGDGYRLRWFTPKVEVDLCGHATLASAHVLWTEGRVPATSTINFYTNSGVLKAVRRGDLIELDFPLDPPSEISPPPELLPALGVSAKYVGKGRFDYLVEVQNLHKRVERIVGIASALGNPVSDLPSLIKFVATSPELGRYLLAAFDKVDDGWGKVERAGMNFGVMPTQGQP